MNYHNSEVILGVVSHKVKGGGSKLLGTYVVKISTYTAANFLRWVNKIVFYRASRFFFFPTMPPEAVVLKTKSLISF